MNGDIFFVVLAYVRRSSEKFALPLLNGVYISVAFRISFLAVPLALCIFFQFC